MAAIARAPKLFAIQAKSPFTGCISMFFQISAETVGMTKKGAITSKRTMPCPKNGWSSKSARKMPPMTVINSTPKTSRSVLIKAVLNAGSVRK
jgi:hypothetical protein